MINWKTLSQISQLEEIDALSKKQPVALFKHSTRCSISAMAKARLERSGDAPMIDFFFLDLLSFRDLSNKIAEHYNVPHESPQILLIKDGDCIYEESHNGINMSEIAEQVGD